MRYFICILLNILVFTPVIAALSGRKIHFLLPAWLKSSRSLAGGSAEAAKCLHPGSDPKKAVKRHVMRKLRTLYLLTACAVCAVSLYLCFYNTPVVENNRIGRSQADGSSRSVDLTVSVGDEKENVTLSVKPRRYTEEERNVLMQEVKAYIRKTLPGENPDLNHVTLPLQFENVYPESPVSIEWMPEDYNLILQDGTLGEIHPELFPVQTSVTAVIRYDEFEEEYPLSVTITGISRTEEENLRENLDAALRAADESSREENELTLPGQISGKKAVWKYRSNMLLPALIGAFGAAAFFLLRQQEETLQKEIRRRREELEREYPAFVHRMVLMLGAGMTVRRSWESILKEDTESNRGKYLRREMQYALRRMNAGIPEIQVYREFGQRAPGYEQFSQLLVQIIRKGNRGMQEMMMREAKDAQRKRREIAARLGETAGTRLLLPMMMLLLLVLIIVMAPAMLSM